MQSMADLIEHERLTIEGLRERGSYALAERHEAQLQYLLDRDT